MLRNCRLQMIAMLAIGGLLGYAAASGNLRLNRAADAASPSAQEKTTTPPDQRRAARMAMPRASCWRGRTQRRRPSR